MDDIVDKKPSIEITPCSFQFHEFEAPVGELTISCHTIKTEDCLYLWIGDSNKKVMNDLSFSLISKYDQLPIATKIIGPVADPVSTNIAKRLTKKLGIPVYVSFNIATDNLSLPGIEKKIQEELKARAELLQF